MIGQLRSIVFDCPDPSYLAAFYSTLLGLPRTVDEPGWVVIGGPDLGRIAFQHVDGYQPPDWPGQCQPQQLHLDVLVEDIAEAEREVRAIGATRLPGGDGTFRVYADPAGHPFCLLWKQ
ncbi:MAG: VOC family protein [Dactylosporangium sp.]|nr:VOC family protein [Dactylosporangium sp.]NNJ59452.1 VOC family protein [Dactylosporangium sp.]